MAEIKRKMKYLGVQVEYKEIRTGGPTSEREIRIKWLEDAVGQTPVWPAGTVTSRTIKGNFAKGTLVVLVETHEVNEF